MAARPVDGSAVLITMSYGLQLKVTYRKNLVSMGTRRILISGNAQVNVIVSKIYNCPFREILGKIVLLDELLDRFRCTFLSIISGATLGEELNIKLPVNYRPKREREWTQLTLSLRSYSQSQRRLRRALG